MRSGAKKAHFFGWSTRSDPLPKHYLIGNCSLTKLSRGANVIIADRAARNTYKVTKLGLEKEQGAFLGRKQAAGEREK